MAEAKRDHNAECAGDLHEEHLCYLMYEGVHLNRRAEYKELVQEAAFICMNCGRTAKHEKNLCAPVKL